MQERAKVWTSSTFTLQLAAAAQPGQISAQPLANLRAALDLSHLVGYTIIDSRIRGIVHSDDAETGTGIDVITFGIGIFTGSIDNGDFPRVDLYEGDWLLWGTNTFFLPGAANKPVLPDQMSVIDVRSRAQRRINDVGDTLFLVAQQSAAEGIDLSVQVTHLVLMP